MKRLRACNLIGDVGNTIEKIKTGKLTKEEGIRDIIKTAEFGIKTLKQCSANRAPLR